MPLFPQAPQQIQGPPGLPPGGPPLELAMLLSHLAQQGGPQGPPPGPGGSPEDAPIAILRQMLLLAHHYMQVEPDEADKATMAKLQATLQSYLAKDQSDKDQAMGGNPTITRMMRKSG